MSKPKWGTRAAILTGALAVMLLAPAAASAVEINPNTTADEFNENANACSLREAIEAANTDTATNSDGCVQGSGADTIELQPGAVYEITRVGIDGMNVSGDLDIRLGDLTVVGNGATIDGNGLTTLDRTVEIANFAPPITVTMSNLTIRDGGGPVSAPGINGGGIGLFGATQAHTLNLSNSTITDNRGIVGGGINVGDVGTANLRNVTVSGNSASVDGGGLISEGTVLLSNTTVTQNTANADGDFIGGGGGLVPTSDAIQLRNTIVQGNTDGGQGTKENECDGAGALTSLGNNVVGTVTDCTFNPSTGDQIGVASAGLLPLASNGGPVQTHGLTAGSPPVDRGASCEPDDARGLLRALGGSACDVGAYERALCGTAVVNVIGTAGNDVLQGTSGADGILALGGRDTVAGLAGADGLCGGAGKDNLKGGAGKDRLLGEAGKDRLAGGKGKDRLLGGAGKDNLIGGKGKDRCKGGAGKDKQKSC